MRECGTREVADMRKRLHEIVVNLPLAVAMPTMWLYNAKDETELDSPTTKATKQAARAAALTHSVERDTCTHMQSCTHTHAPRRELARRRASVASRAQRTARTPAANGVGAGAPRGEE